MTDWYYQAQDEIVGPVSRKALQEKIDAGDVDEDTLVREGAGGPWVAASTVDDPVGLSAGGTPALTPQDGTAGVPAPSDGPGIHRSPLALRPCSDCGQMVSKQANTCPKCGRAFHESSFTVRFQGEQPVLAWPVIIILALAFALLSPRWVYGVAKSLAPPGVTEGGEQVAAHNFALAVAGFYLLSIIICAALGAAIGRTKMARITGALLGLCFGPLGLLAAFGIDKRPLCPQCYSRLNGMAKECPACHAQLIWKVEPTWF
ncbi:MAG: GYF domain-containing protein [Planctomycetota bacterium]|jgi:RNA polymerase subunit RPABC4/transcription elongation factor Spt4